MSEIPTKFFAMDRPQTSGNTWSPFRYGDKKAVKAYRADKAILLSDLREKLAAEIQMHVGAGVLFTKRSYETRRAAGQALEKIMNELCPNAGGEDNE